MYSSIPLKSVQKTDISKPLLNYAKKSFDVVSFENLKKILPNIEDYRKRVVGTKKFVNDDTLTTFLTYYSYVRQIVQSFPVIEQQPVGISVKWYDIYGKDSATTYNFAYEQACVLADIAALHSQKAHNAITDVHTLENVQEAVVEYKEAANCYLYIRQNMMNSYAQVPKTWDMDENGLLGLENYCHGLSQLALVVKAHMTGIKAFGIAALLNGCKKLFDDAGRFFNLCGMKEYLNRCKMLSYLCTARAYLYLNSFYMEKCQATNRGAGLCVGFCNEVKRMMAKISEKFDRSTIALFSKEIDEITKQAASDYSSALNNNRVFLEAEVPVNEFPPVEPRIQHALEDPKLPDIQEDAFKSMVPQSVSDALQRYHQYVEENMNKDMKTIEDANKELKDCQAALHISAILNAGEVSQGISDELWNSIQRLQQEGTIDTFMKSLKDERELSKSVHDDLIYLQQSINRKKPEIMQINQRTGRPVINIDMFDDQIRQCSDLLEQGKAGEKQIEDCAKNVESTVSLLGLSREAIDQQLPKGGISAPTAKALEQLRMANDEIEHILADREAKINEALALAGDDVKVRDELIRNRSLDERGIFARGYLVVQNKFKELNTSITCQNTYISDLQAKYHTYNQASQVDSVLENRQKFFQQLEKAAENLRQGQHFIDSGNSFFTQMKDKIQQVRNSFEQATQQLSQSSSVPSYSYGGNNNNYPPQYPPSNPYPSQMSGSQYPSQNSYPPQYPPQNPYPSNPYPANPYPPQNSYPANPYPPQNSYPSNPYPPQGNDNYKVCNVCGTKNDKYTSSCVSCGRKL